MRMVVVCAVVMVVMRLRVGCGCSGSGSRRWSGGWGVGSGLRGGVKRLGMLGEVLGYLGLLLSLLREGLVVDWRGWLLLLRLLLLLLLLLRLLLLLWLLRRIRVPGLRRLLNDRPSRLAAGGAHSFVLVQGF